MRPDGIINPSLLIGYVIIATMNPNWNDLADEFGILFDE